MLWLCNPVLRSLLFGCIVLGMHYVHAVCVAPIQSYIIIIIWTLQHSVACDDIKIVVKVAERNADRQHQNRVVKLRTIYM